MVKLTLTFWVVTLITCLAQGESRAIESVDFDLEDGFNYTCPPYCDYCTDDDTSCRYYPDARNEEGGMPWGLILVSALVSAFFFCILPLWVCFCYRKGAEPQTQIIYIQGRAPPGYQQLPSLPGSNGGNQ